MKGFIFCLLAFCVFQTVFTNKDREMLRLRARSFQMIYGIERELRHAVMVIGDAAYDEGVSVGSIENCQQHFNSAWDYKFMNPKIEECERCHNEAAHLMDLKIAEKCCKEQINEMKTQAEIDHNTFKECISRCIQQDEAAAAAGPRGTKRREN